MMEGRFDLAVLTPASKRTLLRVKTTFLEAVDFATCGFLTIARLAEDLAGAALTEGATRATDKAKNPTIFSARLKS